MRKWLKTVVRLENLLEGWFVSNHFLKRSDDGRTLLGVFEEKFKRLPGEFRGFKSGPVYIDFKTALILLGGSVKTWAQTAANNIFKILLGVMKGCIIGA